MLLDGITVSWMNHSHTDEVADTESNQMHSINGYVMAIART
jgi:hypothetical protein